MSSRVSLIVKLNLQEGARDDVIASFADYFPTVEGEEGTLVYSIHTDSGDENADAMGAHSSSDAFKAFSGAFGAKLAGAPEFHMCTPVQAKGHPA